MNKVKRKELVEKANEHELRLFQIEKALEQHGVNWFVEEPKLKQLDQSVFDGLDEKWRFAAVDKSGKAWVYSGQPERNDGYWFVVEPVGMVIGEHYDGLNWQNSLIERDIAKELTGSDLCRAMLEHGDKVVLCAVSDDGDFIDGVYDAIHSVNEDGMFESFCSFWWYVQPVNNQGEPLTAADVGL